jgi:branched-chain amino acid transport system ATP-binding protein
MLSLDRLVAGYGRIVAVHGVSMQVAPGQVVCLLGANGAGKTTVLNCISGMVPVRSGAIRWDGQSIAGWLPDRIVAAGIVQVPEGRAVFRSMSVRENLALGAWHRRGPAIRRDTDQMLDWFPVLRERLRQPAGTLSGGEQQMLMIARALLARPRLLLLDEPSLGLSPVMVQTVLGVVGRLRETGISVLLVEQNARAALRLSEVGYVLENGEIVAEGKAADLAENESVRDAYLGH